MTTTRRRFLRTGTLAGLGLTLIPSRMRAGVAGRTSLDDVQVLTIGCGKQARGLSTILDRMDGVRVVAACDVSEAHLNAYATTRQRAHAEAGEAGGEVARYREYTEALDHPGLDAVFIVTPDHQHAPMAIAALDRGLHVYCEKPLAHTVEEGRAMVEATERSGKVLQTGSMQRSMYNFQQTVKVVQSGKLGKIKRVLVSVGPPPRPFDLEQEELPAGTDWEAWVGPSVMRPYNHELLPPLDVNMWGQWRAFAEYGGGWITDWGAHMFDIVQWALDKDDSGPVRFFPPGGDAEYGLTFFYEDGTEVIHRQFGRGNAIRFEGERGSLDVSRGILDSTITGLLPPNAGRKDQGNANLRHFEDWFAAMRGTGEVNAPAEVGHRTSSLCNICNIAYRLRQPLYWDPAAERFTGYSASRANHLLGPAFRLSLA